MKAPIKCSRCAKHLANTPEVKRKRAESVHNYYEDHPEAKKDLIAKIKLAQSNPDTQRRKSESLKAYYRDPKNRDKHSESCKRAYESPEIRAKISDIRKKTWNQPGYKEAYFKKHPDARTRLATYRLDHPELVSRYAFRSTSEKEIEAYIQSFGLETRHDHTVLNSQEIDILIPSKNLGIEDNGMRFHCNPLEYFTAPFGKSVPSDYHILKFQACRDKGIHLIQITEHDWGRYDQQVKIKHYLHDLLTDDKIRYYARKLTLKPVDPLDAKIFYQEYHLQGCNIQFPINYGLYCGEELISCISFGKSRVRNKVNPEGYYELHRYCVKFNCTVLGGAEKLFKHFIRTYNPVEIKSFSDNDYFSGGIYERLGFKEEDQVRVYYWWESNELRPRESCQLSILKELFPDSYNEACRLKESKEITNREVYIMEKEGYMMYTTSGRTKWVWVAQ